ncbi:protein cup-shaped cotyledon 3, partial [Tanacetum coccineum]
VGRGKVTVVVDSGMGATIGTRSRYRFYSGSLRVWKISSSWKMVEYSSKGTLASNFSLCCVYKSENSKDAAAAKN